MKRTALVGVQLVLVAALLAAIGCSEESKKKMWLKAFNMSCSAQADEDWMDEYCSCVGTKLTSELTLQELSDTAKVTKLAEKYAPSCLPKDMVTNQWTAAFVESCTDAGQKKAYCECAAEKATTAWTSEQLADPEYTSAHIKEVAKDCK